MPQTDVLTFPAAVAVLPFVFLGGYALFVTRGVPRVLLVFRARAWLASAPAVGVPEFALGVVQFAGLVAVVAGLTLVAGPAGTLPGRPARPARPARPVPPGGAVLGGWALARPALFFAPAAGALAGVVHRVGDLVGSPPARRLAGRLGRRLSGVPPRVGG